MLKGFRSVQPVILKSGDSFIDNHIAASTHHLDPAFL